jgi:hypothetical protein
MTPWVAFRALLLMLPILMLAVTTALAHCDTMDGPVVRDARSAIASRDVTLVLKWVHQDGEQEVREAFSRTLAVRALGQEAERLADRFFFETLVRIHRQGEGAPYTGLKPAGADMAPAIAASDGALESGSVDALVKLLAAEAERGIRDRFARAADARRHMGESVERGRAYVAAYVDFVHHAERLHSDAISQAGHAEHEGPRLPEAHSR